MTKEEALLFFPFEDSEEEIDDVYENFLFEYKQFFLSKTPLKKVFQSKLNKLMKLHEAYLVLGGENVKKDFQSINIELKGDVMIEIFNQYQDLRNQIKVHLMSAINAEEIQVVISHLLELEDKFNSCWPLMVVEGNEDVKIGLEPDYMKFYEALKELKEKQIFTFKELEKSIKEKNEDNSINFILMELKRLSLLRKTQ